MLLRSLLPGVFDRQSEGEPARFRERSKPRARKLNGHPQHLIGLTDPSQEYRLIEPVQALLRTATASCVPETGKYRQTLKGPAGRIEHLAFEVKTVAPPKTINLSETYFSQPSLVETTSRTPEKSIRRCNIS
jgi:hypothetical protein